MVFGKFTIIKYKKKLIICYSVKKITEISILIGSEQIMWVFETKFLGVSIQSNLKWNSHVSSVANKI